MRTGLRVALAGLLLAAAAVRPAAQATPPQTQTPPVKPAADQQATFRSRIDTIMVDVQVTDKQGRPVLDLKQQDFEIRENNKIQTVDSFKLVKLDDEPVNPDTLPAILSPEDQQREVAREDSRLIVILMDDYHTLQLNALRVRQQVAAWVRQLPPRDLVAIMTPLMPASALTFSHDHNAVAGDIMHFIGRKREYDVKNAFDQMTAMMSHDEIDVQRAAVSLSALQTVCAYLGSLREGRKQLLYVSEGFLVAPTGVGFSSSGRSPNSMQNSAMQSQEMDIFAAAGRSNTSIYTLDPRGLAVGEYGASANKTLEQDRRDLETGLDSLRVIAENTGGRAIVGQNEPMAMLRQLTRDSSAYYLLSFTSTERYRDKRFHPFKVSVLGRKDIEIRAKNGYYAYSEDEVAKITAPPKPGLPKDVQAALENLEETRRGRAVQVWLSASKGDNGKALVTLVWEALPAQRGDFLGTVDHINVTATSIFGDPLYSGVVTRDPSSTIGGGRVSFAAPPGSVAVKVVAETEKGQRLDTDDTEFSVPDFSKVGVTITRPSVFRARTALDVRNIRAAAEPIPSVGRAFQRSERLLIRFQAFGPGGQTPKITMRLLNRLGEPMADLPAPQSIAGGLFESELGLNALPAGDYLVEIAAAVGEEQSKTLLAFQISG